MIKFNRNTNIMTYDVDVVLENIKKENKSGKTHFVFDTNYSMVHFFNYFIESLEHDESRIEDLSLVTNFLQSKVANSPKDFNEAVEKAFLLLDLDHEVKQIFAKTTPQVICAFLYTNFSKLVFDEFYFFYDKCSTLTNITKDLKIVDVEQILYEIILAVSYRIRSSLKDVVVIPQTFEMTTQDFENMVKSPENLKECIDWLLNSIESKNSNFENITLSDSTSTDVLTCRLFGEVYHILYFVWYLHYDKSPLRKFFEKERAITDSYYIVYYIIRNFVNFLLLKKSM